MDWANFPMADPGVSSYVKLHALRSLIGGAKTDSFGFRHPGTFSTFPLALMYF
jgi:hypothetical protein